MDKFILKYRGKSYIFSVGEFPNKAEVDDMVRIDINNIIGELVTFPVLMNKLGLFLSEAKKQVAEAELSFKVWQAKFEESYATKKVKAGEKYPTVKDMEIAVIQSPEYEEKKREIINKQKLQEDINSIYWSAKEKQENLKKMSLTLKEGDLKDYFVGNNILELNTVNLKKINKKLIDDEEE